MEGAPESPMHSKTNEDGNNRDYLWQNLKDLPYFRALLRAVEARFYADFDLKSPILDLGCGDGHFATIAFDRPLDVGLDPWTGPIREATHYGSYHSLVQANGANTPFPEDYFNAAISNSVLEHIPNIDEVLSEIGRVLKSGAPFLFCVPNHNFSNSLSIGRWLDSLGLTKLGDIYRDFFNHIARHEHLDPPEIWIKRLEGAGFGISQWWNYYSPAAMRVSEWGHYLGLPSLVSRKLTGRWVLIPSFWNLGLTYRLIKPYYLEPSKQDDGVCTFYVAYKK